MQDTSYSPPRRSVEPRAAHAPIWEGASRGCWVQLWADDRFICACGRKTPNPFCAHVRAARGREIGLRSGLDTGRAMHGTGHLAPSPGENAHKERP
jgi:hypothetical protein